MAGKSAAVAGFSTGFSGAFSAGFSPAFSAGFSDLVAGGSSFLDSVFAAALDAVLAAGLTPSDFSSFDEFFSCATAQARPIAKAKIKLPPPTFMDLLRSFRVGLPAGSSRLLLDLLGGVGVV